MNELTFVARLGTATALRAERRREAGETCLIARGDVEEKQVDADGHVRRCDIRLNSAVGRKLASGEVKRPETPEGRDPTNEPLVADARRKAVARGLPYYFTCNMAQVVLYEVAKQRDHADLKVRTCELAPITHSSQVEALMPQIEGNWIAFLDDLEARLSALASTRPSVTNEDVILLRDAIYMIADDVLPRAERRLLAEPDLAETVKDEAANSFGFRIALDLGPRKRADFRQELRQILCFGVFVEAQKLVLYRVLQDAGRRRSQPFTLDRLTVRLHGSSSRERHAGPRGRTRD